MRRSRSQPIRSAIVSLVTVPIVALVLLWSLTAFGTYDNGIELAHAQKTNTHLVRPTQALIKALQYERRLSLASIAGPGNVEATRLADARERTDGARDVYIRDTADKDLLSTLSPALKEKAARFSTDLGGLGPVRTLAGARKRQDVFEAYNRLIADGYTIFRTVSSPTAGMKADIDVLVSLGQARESTSRIDAIVAGKLAFEGRPMRLAPWDREQIARSAGTRDFLYDDSLEQLTRGDHERYTLLRKSDDFRTLVELENRIISGGVVDQGAWDTVALSVNNHQLDLESQAVDGIAERAQSDAGGVLLKLALGTLFGLIAVIVSIVVAWRVARRLIRESRALADTVGGFTRDQLPVLAALVRKGEKVEDPGDPGVHFSVTEIERIFRSFVSARSAVLEAAHHEAQTMKGVSEVFVNLSSRQQALLHRQLTLLDQMERDADDPEELERLFQLDHLATRMRRHAEGLVILSGKSPGRGWRQPVPLMDVVRGAASEVEDYARVRVAPMPRKALMGPAVADVIHLLADLIENAVQYSPPDTPIEVSGQGVASGYVLEIEDRGLGLPPESFEELNARLAAPPEFNLNDSARLGLFVVARLARRHGIKVQLRPSPYGGTTAVVFLPQGLVAADLPESAPAPEPAVAPAPALVEVASGRTAGGPQPALRPAEAAPTGETHLDLPKRRRKPAPPTGTTQPTPIVGDSPDRSPEDLRLRMSAMQKGWQRGRIESASESEENP
ncbi:sensor histidine kinase [Actinocorallia longicatena]|uniref:histidine kinase n=1 Tax=Actinocorallia longicatena TaxID=111803 RepID=A0ABP6QF76_9ACTN